MAVEKVTFVGGKLTVTDSNGQKTENTTVQRLAQVVTALTRILIERDLVDDQPLTDKNGTAIELESLLDMLVTDCGAEIENEGIPK